MVLDRVVTSFRWRVLSPKTPKICRSDLGLKTIGSKYGRKTFAQTFKPGACPTMISAGVGEDISFDLEFQALTGARIILVDPTPAAIDHFYQLRNYAGRDRIEEYSQTSRQKPENYSLLNVDLDKISYVAKALWSDETTLPFFEPKDLSRDGSFSLNSIHNFYTKSAKSIQVEATTISKIVETNRICHLDVLKLDIEGAALEVIEDAFYNGIFPGQLLLEIDEIHFPSLTSRLRARKIFRMLKKNGYEPIFRDNCDFIFFRMKSHG